MFIVCRATLPDALDSLNTESPVATSIPVSTICILLYNNVYMIGLDFWRGSAMNSIDAQTSRALRSAYIPPSQSPVGYHRDALAYWQVKRGARIAPRWNDVSLMDFPPHVIPLIAVTDIDPETFELCYRFWGTQLTAMHGRDYTGVSPAELEPKLLGDGSVEAYRVLVREKAPQLEIKEFFRGEVLRGRQIVLRLPLSDDGRAVSQSLNVTYQELAGPARPHSEFFDHVLAQD